MKQLSDTLLLQSYHKAIELNLSQDFIKQIEEEIQERSITHLVDKKFTQVG
ncbi:sporulation histidine kinase inhibitor Sda [Halobacillus amylolyticus]|uniref:Sporulation histidine kinase inhibitor Sda n=1 Tax=Halobacillus amylolyticus TaxID=2932259 RepID=A0ABY4HC46_9BACI|nr:sporulation histidine kinase inhibitor Sda [Halobacillus amylolyticus]UOR12242.1 sporulation histidine kinase inhibitor Sda [Halobacillus amylolyticus]